MNAPSMKDKIVQTVQSLPADATVEDAMERLLFLAKSERGLQQADKGETIPHDEVRRRFVKFIARDWERYAQAQAQRIVVASSVIDVHGDL